MASSGCLRLHYHCTIIALSLHAPGSLLSHEPVTQSMLPGGFQYNRCMLVQRAHPRSGLPGSLPFCHSARDRGTLGDSRASRSIPSQNQNQCHPINAECPAKIHAELAGVLPGADLSHLLIVPTCQRAVMDLVKTGEEVEVEKDKLLEQVGCALVPVCAAGAGGACDPACYAAGGLGNF